MATHVTVPALCSVSAMKLNVTVSCISGRTDLEVHKVYVLSDNVEDTLKISHPFFKIIVHVNSTIAPTLAFIDAGETMKVAWTPKIKQESTMQVKLVFILPLKGICSTTISTSVSNILLQ